MSVNPKPIDPDELQRQLDDMLYHGRVDAESVIAAFMALRPYGWCLESWQTAEKGGERTMVLKLSRTPAAQQQELDLGDAGQVIDAARTALRTGVGLVTGGGDRFNGYAAPRAHRAGEEG